MEEYEIRDWIGAEFGGLKLILTELLERILAIEKRLPKGNQ